MLKSADNTDIGIIGAGLGGLSAAAYLSAAGFHVSVFEKNHYAGGKAGTLQKEGFRFDTGASVVTMPFVLRDLFNACNEDIEDYLTISRLNISCRYFYPDGTIINAYSDPDRFADEIGLKTNDHPEAVKRYFRYCSSIYNLTSEPFLFSPEINLKSLLNPKFLNSLLSPLKIDPFRTMHNANKSFFRDSKTLQLFDRFATYNGSDPYRAPATLNIIPYVELILGTYIIAEGISAVSAALKKLAEDKGAKFYTGQNVEKILTKDGSAVGLRAGNKDYVFNSVISNLDVRNTYRDLLGKQLKEKIEPSMSGIVFYWGIKGNHNSLEIHNIIFSENYKKEFEDISIHRKCPDDPTIYIYVSSRYKSDDAPEGYENWFVMVNTPYNSGQDWDQEVERIREVAKLRIQNIIGINLSEKIVFEEILTPSDIELKTGSLSGSIYGFSSNSKTSAFRRPPIKSSFYKNLFFCGGSVHPGGGIPLVLLSGKHASELICREYL